MEIIRGKIKKAQKIVVYGPEGIGKTTFASRFPDPIFIDTEGGTAHIDVARTPSPSSWTMLMEQVRYFRNHPSSCRSLIIDTADWAERMCVEHICAKSQVDGIEGFGYGKGYIYLKEEFGRLLNLLEEVREVGINPIFNAHATMRKIEQPEEIGAYDHWELKLSKQVAPLVKEWSDMLLFANYKINVVNIDNQGATKGKNKAQGGKRIMYATHTPAWDAKNRHELPDEMPFDYEQIKHIFAEISPVQAAKPEPEQIRESKPEPDKPTVDTSFINQMEMDFEGRDSGKKSAEAPKEKKSDLSPARRKLKDLMESNLISEEEIQWVVAKKGYFPQSTPIENYGDDFIEGWLVAFWDKVYEMIRKDLDKTEIPFEQKNGG